mmetsp:Transcript_4012/g.7748  ORF Transcript_4012/g.7748 Transcript_4012/m.7748 type:complete len:218 (-) Transcript_4012:321-974(-)
MRLAPPATATATRGVCWKAAAAKTGSGAKDPRGVAEKKRGVGGKGEAVEPTATPERLLLRDSSRGEAAGTAECSLAQLPLGAGAAAADAAKTCSDGDEAVKKVVAIAWFGCTGGRRIAVGVPVRDETCGPGALADGKPCWTSTCARGVNCCWVCPALAIGCREQEASRPQAAAAEGLRATERVGPDPPQDLQPLAPTASTRRFADAEGEGERSGGGA